MEENSLDTGILTMNNASNENNIMMCFLKTMPPAGSSGSQGQGHNVLNIDIFSKYLTQRIAGQI